MAVVALFQSFMSQFYQSLGKVYSGESSARTVLAGIEPILTAMLSEDEQE